MDTVQYKGVLYKTAKQAQKTKFYLIHIMGIELLIPSTSRSAARDKAAAILRPSKGWRLKDLKPLVVPAAAYGRLRGSVMGVILQENLPSAPQSSENVA